MTTKRILTVSLNAAVDVTYVVDQFRVGKINLVGEMTRVSGGKANNAARVLVALGQNVIATGFVGGTAGQFIRTDLRQRGIQTEFVTTDGENRTCTSIFDPAGRTLTEVREKGPTLTEGDADRFLTRFRSLVRQVDLVVISGSLPPGIPADYYARLVSEGYRTAQVRTIVDASGEALRQAAKAQPYLVKPNLEELEEWAGTRLPDDAAVLKAARRLMEAGPLVVAVSLGARGLILVAPNGAWQAVPPQVEAVNTVGSGDSLVAGFATGLLQELPATEILQLAVGCGTANALNNEVALVQAEDLARIQPKVRVERIG